MKDFAAIDFETANNERSSVCSVGIAIVRNGEIIYPKGNDVILADDHIIVVTTQHGLQDVTDIFAK